MIPNASARPASAERVALLAFTAILLVSAALRIVPAFGDFWLDEIWTYFSVRSLAGAWQIFDGLHDSNNHYLNSLLFYWIGDRENFVLYRIPALTAGIASVPLAFALARKHGRLEAVLAAFLVGFCFTLIHFSSEARGYSLAVFFALAATWLLDRFQDRPSTPLAVGFHVCSILGFLAHLTFLFFVAGAFAVSLARLVRRREAPMRAAASLAALYAPTLLVVAALGWIDLRVLHVGRGDPTEWTSLASRTVGYSLGLPVAPGFAWPGLACAAAIGATAGRLSRRAGDDEWLLVLVTLVVAPALVLGVMRPSVVEVRYFVVGIALYLVLAARLAAALLRAGGWRRVLCGASLCLFALGNAAHLLPFLRYGRGGYAAAVRFMAESSPNPEFSVGSNHDFRNEMILRFYARELPPGRGLDYVGLKAKPREAPDWVIVLAAQRPEHVQPALTDIRGHRYRFAREFRSGGISGFWWGVYRNPRLEPAPGQSTPGGGEGGAPRGGGGGESRRGGGGGYGRVERGGGGGADA
jgi:hypothetical protein